MRCQLSVVQPTVSALQGTSRIVRALIGPEDGEDDDEDDIELFDGTNRTADKERSDDESITRVTTVESSFGTGAEAVGEGNVRMGGNYSRGRFDSRGNSHAEVMESFCGQLEPRTTLSSRWLGTGHRDRIQ